MSTKKLFISLAKLIFCGLAYSIGLIIGGLVASLLKLPQPPMPAGVDSSSAAISMFMLSPILSLALALIDQGIAGNWLTRTLILSSLTYIAYTLNTSLDASIYVTAYGVISSFLLISAIFPTLFCAGAVALMFPPKEKTQGFATACKAFFSQKNPGQWLWRLLLAGLAFMPVYIAFGLLVNPITGDYYRQHMFGLKAAGWDQILPILFLRSLLFLVASLPVMVAWQKSKRTLLLSLGTALFILVGLIYMLISIWLPWFVRIPHSIEILADSFVYAGILTWLLAGRTRLTGQKYPPMQITTMAER